MKQLLLLFFVAIAGVHLAQDCGFKQDTVFVPSEKKTVNTELLETTLKNNLHNTKIEFYYLIL